MSTFLFDNIVFGPVNSRRLGVSLGINLLPVNKKICSFNCIYCECGLNGELGDKSGKLPTREVVKSELADKLQKMNEQGIKPNVITFAGNGEPTLHPQFAEIIDDTILIRNQLCPEARIAVLSNATRLSRKEVFDALLKVDDNIQKLDSARIETIRLLDQPETNFNLDKTIERLIAFKGKVIIQTMFISGSVNGQRIDNTSGEDLNAWVKAIEQIKPHSVMIYTIDRDTPHDTLKKVPIMELNTIAEQLRNKGFNVSVSG